MKKNCIIVLLISVFLVISVQTYVAGTNEKAPTKEGLVAVEKAPTKEVAVKKVPTKEGPVAVVPNPKFEAEPVLEGEDITHEFIIKNTGTQALNISRVKTG